MNQSSIMVLIQPFSFDVGIVVTYGESGSLSHQPKNSKQAYVD